MVFLNEKASEYLLEECKTVFITAMTNCHRVMDKDAFRFRSETEYRRPINMPLFEIMMYIFADNQILHNIPLTKKEVEKFKERFDHQQIFTGNVDSALNLDERFKLAEELIKQIKNDKENIYK